eukprot:619058_1
MDNSHRKERMKNMVLNNTQHTFQHKNHLIWMSFLLTVTVSCLEFCGYCWSLCGAWHAVVIEILLNLGAILTRICIGFVMMLETFIVFCICRIWHWHCGGVGVLNEKAWIEYVFGIGIEEDLWHLRLVIATDIAAIVAATAIFINIWCWRGLFVCSKSAFMDKREQIWNQKNHKIHQRRYCFVAFTGRDTRHSIYWCFAVS